LRFDLFICKKEQFYSWVYDNFKKPLDAWRLDLEVAYNMIWADGVLLQKAQQITPF
jgi:hypothetical protein